VPTLVLLEGGGEVVRRVGAASAAELERWLERSNIRSAAGAAAPAT
jgi:hypothetical protein